MPHKHTKTPSQAVSIRADDNYMQGLRSVAREQGRHVADVVREAVDLLHGDRIGFYASFFAQAGQSLNQKERGATSTDKKTPKKAS